MPSETTVTGKSSSEIENVDWSTGTVAGPHYASVVRFGSGSSQASQSSGDICRICHCESDPQNPLLTPCYCSGSLKYVHQACLQQWLTASGTNACELCKFPFIMHTKIKPFNEWRSLDMSGVQRRRLCCAVILHCAAALCVIWSLCVLIERAAEEVERGLIGWPFWTKLAVVTVGLTGGVVFMYLQCRQYLHLCHRWRARNRILLIQNAPEKVHPLSPPSPVLASRNIPRNSSATGGSAMTTNSLNQSCYGYASSVTNRSMSCATTNQMNYPNAPQHGQIVANIENNSQNYERDWTLDDVSQISSFRPCPQGSGSMTPFHDSIHNVLENSRSCSNSSSGSNQDLNNLIPNSSNNSRTSDLELFKSQEAQSISDKCNGIAQGNVNNANSIRYPNSSVFLENRDILNDSGYPKINYRHSSVLTSPDISENLDKFLGKDLRRYSDTKLLQDNETINPIFNVALHTPNSQITFKDEIKSQKINNYCNNSSNNHVTATTAPPQVTEIIFENINQFDPLELNIQQMLEIDTKQNNNNYNKKSRHSLNCVEPNNELECDPAGAGAGVGSHNRTRLSYKSLPNLTGSCESLLKN